MVFRLGLRGKCSFSLVPMFSLQTEIKPLSLVPRTANAPGDGISAGSAWLVHDPSASSHEQQTRLEMSQLALQPCPTNSKPAWRWYLSRFCKGQKTFSLVSQIIMQPETRPICQGQLRIALAAPYASERVSRTPCGGSQRHLCRLNNRIWFMSTTISFSEASIHSLPHQAWTQSSKYAMPARMWGHEIPYFLEHPWPRLPASFKKTLTFIYLVYLVMGFHLKRL
ncbi:hypothetical protein DL95DRAFT_5714 [Leptodontidium sp. 2 PMI_412]|nr:hypothetical protein DL95DRAFT_5714 [Leptodontidium sp. 2 PMI_412]